MRARDVMVHDVITIHPDDSIADAAKLITENDVSALPVVDNDGRLVGLISGADLMNREEIGTTIHRPWWIEAVTPAATLAAEFASRTTRRSARSCPNTSSRLRRRRRWGEIAAILERHRIKRVPILRHGNLVSIVSRSNLVQALASHREVAAADVDESHSIRLELLSRLGKQTWTDFGSRNVIVTDGKVHLWGLVGSDSERKALIALAEGVPGVTEVIDEMIPAYK
jgi:CBS domain-containing protein